MRSTFRVLFYTKNQAIKNGRVPVMGRITVNGTTASFSCKRDVPLARLASSDLPLTSQRARGTSRHRSASTINISRTTIRS